jgi:sterol desaturase/sphingolipid hydroxylase (fatty acid hydroxylase superfamily)
MMRATPESPRMFETDLFDFFSRTPPLMVPLLYLPGSLLPLIYGIRAGLVTWTASCLLFALGFVAWTLTEYCLHRTVFHYQHNSPLGERVHFLIHGVHHTWPRDKYRLVMPPAVSLSLYILFGLFHRWILGPNWMWPYQGGFVAGYLFYDMTHYATHHLRPITAYGKRLRRHHLLHHFKNPNSRFGVSSPLWDWVFGTLHESSPPATLKVTRTISTANVEN